MVEQLNLEKKIPKKRGRKPKKIISEASISEASISEASISEASIIKPMASISEASISEDAKNIPKKRGRKPKVKKNDEPKIPKKRGRKPKKISIGKSINNLDSSLVKDTILHLKINSSNLDNGLLMDDMYEYNPNIVIPEPYDPSNNDLETFENEEELIVNNEDSIIEEVNNETTEELFDEKLSKINIRYNETNINCSMNNTTKKKNISPIMIYYNEYNKRKEWPKISNIKCFWCCHNFDNIPCSLPYSYKDNIFLVYGNFCSPECSAAYNFDSKADDRDIWERYSLLNHLYSLIYTTPDLTIKLAPPKLSLKIFGGKLSIEEFRDCNTDYLKNYKIVLPPMVSIIPSLEEIKKDSLKKKDTHYIPIDKDRIKKVNNDLRLKRSKPISNRNTLENCMRLKYNK